MHRYLTPSMDLNKKMKVEKPLGNGCEESKLAAPLPHKSFADGPLAFNPLQGKFASEFFSDPEERSSSMHHGYVRKDFRLNDEEMAVFRKNGFVSSQRLGSKTPADVFLRVYSDDLPVFITADSILHAWHKTYEGALADLEANFFLPGLISMLDKMAGFLEPLMDQFNQDEVMYKALSGVDIMLTVARRIVNPEPIAVSLPSSPSDVVERLVAVIKGERGSIRVNLFGVETVTDGLSFVPAGRYANSEKMRIYFKLFRWLSQGLPIAGGDSLNPSSPVAMAAALLLNQLVQDSSTRSTWNDINQLLTVLIGENDGMTLEKMGELPGDGLLDGPGTDIGCLQEFVKNNNIGMQNYSAELAFTPTARGPQQAKLPSVFNFLGSKFCLDNWALSEVAGGKPEPDGGRRRRLGSGIDVAFSVLGNSTVAELIRDRENQVLQKNSSETEHHRAERDGIPFSKKLMEVRTKIDELSTELWRRSIYNQWLLLLRTLSEPFDPTDTKIPQVFRTRQWANKDLNTQLASWTELRHDNVLYLKKMESLCGGCSYPEGYVEPRPNFWEQFSRMSSECGLAINKVPFPNSVSHVQERLVRAFDRFSKHTATLCAISTKQRRGLDLRPSETKFLKTAVEKIEHGSGPPSFSGWYFDLFYGETAAARGFSAIEPDNISAEIMTAPPDPMGSQHRGCMLYGGTGGVDFTLVAVDDGEGSSTLFAGPTSTHYEFVMQHDNPIGDATWVETLRHHRPARPSWVQGYTVVHEDSHLKRAPGSLVIEGRRQSLYNMPWNKVKGLFAKPLVF